MILSLSDIELSFSNENQSKNIFSHVNCSFNSSSIYHLIGDNGSGKTTLFSLLSGRLKPQSGRIVSDTKSIYDSAKIDVPTELSVKEYLCFLCSFNGIKAIKQIVYDIAELFTIEDILKTKIKHLSLGERQLLSLVQLFFNDYDLLLLDEAFKYVDPSRKERLIDFIVKKFSKSIIIVIEHEATASFPYTHEVRIRNHQLELVEFSSTPIESLREESLDDLDLKTQNYSLLIRLLYSFRSHCLKFTTLFFLPLIINCFLFAYHWFLEQDKDPYLPAITLFKDRESLEKININGSVVDFSMEYLSNQKTLNKYLQLHIKSGTYQPLDIVDLQFIISSDLKPGECQLYIDGKSDFKINSDSTLLFNFKFPLSRVNFDTDSANLKILNVKKTGQNAVFLAVEDFNSIMGAVEFVQNYFIAMKENIPILFTLDEIPEDLIYYDGESSEKLIPCILTDLNTSERKSLSATNLEYLSFSQYLLVSKHFVTRTIAKNDQTTLLFKNKKELDSIKKKAGENKIRYIENYTQALNPALGQVENIFMVILPLEMLIMLYYFCVFSKTRLTHYEKIDFALRESSRKAYALISILTTVLGLILMGIINWLASLVLTAAVIFIIGCLSVIKKMRRIS